MFSCIYTLLQIQKSSKDGESLSESDPKGLIRVTFHAGRVLMM